MRSNMSLGDKIFLGFMSFIIAACLVVLLILILCFIDSFLTTFGATGLCGIALTSQIAIIFYFYSLTALEKNDGKKDNDKRY